MLNFNTVFPALPQDILGKLEQSYNKIKKNFREGRYEPSELNGAKFCEAAYRILEWHTSSTKSYTSFGVKINDFGQSVRRFESMSLYPDSVRFHIPKILDALYTIRNKRGVAHQSGEVDPNYMDAVFVVSACDWVMAELVRLYHKIPPKDAQKMVQDLVTKKIALIWDVGEVKRVLNPELSFKDKTLVLLYPAYPNSVMESELLKWVEHSNPTVFRTKVLEPCHKEKLIEYDSEDRCVTLSPLGLKYVEDSIELEILSNYQLSLA